MIYPFTCPNCNRYDEVWRHHTESHLPLQCNDCGSMMNRIFGGHGLSIPNTDSWNPGLGCRQGQVKEKLRVLKSEKGVELHEIGNERPEPKVKHNEYKLSKNEEHQIGQILNG